MEKQSVRGAMCKLAEDVIAHRAQSNDASLIEAIIPDPHSDFVCVPASYLASLPEIVSFVPALDAAHREKFLVTVLTEFSEHLKANKDKEGKYFIRTEYRRNPQNTLIMHNVPADAKESDLREVFLSIPTAASVSFKKDINSCWLATFDTEANAVATHSALFGQKIVVKDAVISIGLRATRFVHVAPSSSATASTAAAQQATGIPAGSYNGMRTGFPPNMRQQQYFAQQYFMWMPQQQQYYQAMAQARMGGQHQAGWQQQQKQRNGRGNGHSRYQNPAYQQQRAAPEQMAASGAPGAAAAATAATAPAAAAAASTTTAPAPTTAPQQQQQPREGQRGGRGGRNRRYGRGGNRNHGNQAAAGSEGTTAGNASKDHRPRQPAAAATAATERTEQPSKPQKKPTADSFPPLA